jgi:hypothetical protein
MKNSVSSLDGGMGLTGNHKGSTSYHKLNHDLKLMIMYSNFLFPFTRQLTTILSTAIKIFVSSRKCDPAQLLALRETFTKQTKIVGRECEFVTCTKFRPLQAV